MQFYKINIDTNKPITQRIAVPQDCDKYGLVISATRGEGKPIHNLSCTIIDCDNTVTPAKTLDDGSQLFVMSSIGNTSRNVAVQINAAPIVIAGGSYTNDTNRVKLYKHPLPIPAGIYYKDELDICGLYSSTAKSNMMNVVSLSSDTQLDDTNVDNMYVYWGDRHIDFFNKTNPA